MIPSERDKPAGLQLSDFLPVSAHSLNWHFSLLVSIVNSKGKFSENPVMANSVN